MQQKPEKPRPDFPLYAHACGQWVKKIRGKIHYFGAWSDATAALNAYLDVRDDLYAGRKPSRSDQFTVTQAVGEFLTAKRSQCDSGDLSPRTFHEYREACEIILDSFGDRTAVENLRAADFEKLRTALSERLGPSRLTKIVVCVRSVFKYAYEAELIDRLPRFGPMFRGATRKAHRQLRNSKPPREWGAGEIRRFIAAADCPMRALLFLAINCGFGQTDLSESPLSAFDLEGGWVRFPRPKTGVRRDCPLWPETVAAVNAWLQVRGVAPGLMFTTRNGRPLVEFYPETGSIKDSVSLRFRRLCKKLELNKPGLGFYAIRHTFQTVGEGSGDAVAVSHIMGHAAGSNDMAAVYRESIDPPRLVRVANHVREWLLNSGDA